MMELPLKKITKARLAVLRKLGPKPRLLVGPECNAGKWLRTQGLAKYHYLNHYSETEAGVQALKQLAGE